MIATVGAIGKNLARVVRYGIRTCAPIVDIGWRGRDPLDQSGRGVSADMGLEVMHGLAALYLTQRASSSRSVCDTMIVASTMVPVLIRIARAFN